MIIFGVTTFIAAVLSLLLPETLGAPLIESFDDVDKGGGIECKINKANDPVDQVTIIHIANFIFANI